MMLSTKKARFRILIMLTVICVLFVWNVPAASQTWAASKNKVAYPVDNVGGKIYFDKSKGEIVDSTKSVRTVEIPEKIDGVAVKRIGKMAFWRRSNLKSVTISNGMTRIDNSAFEGCLYLKRITMPNSITYIGDMAFAGCQSLENVTLPNRITRIEDQVFAECRSLKNITIPDSVTYIGFGAFATCWNLKSITLSNRITKIKPMAFYGNDLESLTVPSSLTNIGSLAFANCDKLKSVIIEDGVKSINSGAFYECDRLKRITIPNSVATIKGGAIGDVARGKRPQIRGYSNTSSAAKYAKRNGFSYINLNAPVAPANAAPPIRLKIYNASATSVALKWSKQPQITQYQVYRSTKENSGYKKIASTKKTNFKNKKLKERQTYYYKVVALQRGGKHISSNTVAKVKVRGNYKKGTAYGPYMTQKERRQVKNAVAKFVNTKTTPDMGSYEKALIAHDYIAKRCYYDWSGQERGIHSAWGTLVKKGGQCTGFARGYKALCDGLGIKCYYVEPSKKNYHVWNLVKVEGKFHNVDTTADAGGGRDNFLTGGNIPSERGKYPKSPKAYDAIVNDHNDLSNELYESGISID